MRITEKQMIEEEVTIGYTCDACGETVKTNRFPQDWTTLVAMHHEWSNDSVDSIVDYDVCSKHCYFSILNKFLEKFKDYKDSAEINQMSYSFVQKMIEG